MNKGIKLNEQLMIGVYNYLSMIYSFYPLTKQS